MDLQVLREIDLFKNLNPVHLAHLASIMREELYVESQVIFEEGARSDRFYVIYRGRVRISKRIPGMGEEALATLPTGSYFGEMELIEGYPPRCAQATAHEDCILQSFDYDDFHNLMRTDGELAYSILWNMLRTVSLRLSATNDKVATTFAMARFLQGPKKKKKKL